MILLCDATLQDTLVFSAASDDAPAVHEAFALYATKTVPRIQGQDAERFAEVLAEWTPLFEEVSAVGVVPGPGSVGGTRTMLSIVCAFALAKGVLVYPVARQDDTWHATDYARAWVVPVYAHHARITPRTRDALGRKLTTV